ncbi:MAG: DNA translocase FtsK [Acholeplasmatales bacterium]|nr:DNA translocase FtsK [Acholeplasmatales bacterium]
MFKKKKKLIEYEDDKFEIYQIAYPKPLNEQGFQFLKSEVASPIFGSKIPDRISYTDNKGMVDADYNYDYVRNEELKHLSKEDIIERFGSEYHEFQILNNEEIAKYAGTDVPKPDPKVEVENEVVIDKKKKEDSFVTSIDELMDEVNETKEPDLENQDEEFKINVMADDSNEISYNSFDESMPKVETKSIPSFLQSEAKPSKVETGDLSFSFDDEKSDDISFDDIPTMEAPEIHFEARNNAPVDRNITIEEAMRRAENNEFPNLMSGDVGSNRPGFAVETDDKDYTEPVILRPQPRPEEVKADDIKVQEKPKPVVRPMAKAEPKKTLKEVTVTGNDYSNYSVPYDEIFRKSTSGNDSHPAWLEAKKEIINDTLKEFNIGGEVINYTKGPAFTLYEIMLDAGVNVKKVNQIKDNFAMKLEVKSLRILSPIPGRNTVGIEAPNDKADAVPFGDIITEEWLHDGKPLNVALGKLIDNSPLYQNIYNMPHALIAGATQSGKSVSLNTILMSLLIKNSPEDLKLIIVDPKMVEFTLYENIPHLATPIISDSMLATEALHWCVEEMDRRYDVLRRFRVKNAGDYLQKRKEDPSMPPLPYIVVVIDEFNDLVMTSGAEVQDYIVRLAQKARAAGMHVILATQRPTTNVINGTIKANIPCRIAFRVASSMDSMVILDQVGAEELLGRGDMLIVNQGAPVRAQGAYLSDDEIEGLCDYLTSKYMPDYIFSNEDLKKRVSKSSDSFGGKGGDDIAEDVLYEVAKFCVEQQTCSINAIQQSFNMGFNKASKVVGILEDRGIVSPKQGTKPRAILLELDEVDQMFGYESSNYELEDEE